MGHKLKQSDTLMVWTKIEKGRARLRTDYWLLRRDRSRDWLGDTDSDSGSRVRMTSKIMDS